MKGACMVTQTAVATIGTAGVDEDILEEEGF